ncbi:MAG: SCP2 sterol-binding domain-containing protein [Acidimicrobiales bacterium]
MADFLSAHWFEEVNETLARAPAPPVDATPWRLVVEFIAAPATGPHALTLTIDDDGARLEPGDHLGAETLIRLAFDDARALSEGRLTSADALREGRLTVRGDLGPAVTLLAWARDAHHAR